MEGQRAEQAKLMRKQSLALCNNYYYTGQHQKALRMLNQLRKMYPDDEIVTHLLSSICNYQFQIDAPFAVMGGEIPDNKLSSEFGEHWTGQDLNKKSITIFCDQGMGDVVQFLRYVKEMKATYDCEVNLNCYAYFDQMNSMLELQTYVDSFVKEHIKTDYHTNIMSIPAILRGLSFDIYYPAHFRDLLETSIDGSSYLEGFSGNCDDFLKHIGVAWQSNRNNPLSAKKSIDPELFKSFVFNDITLVGLHPEDPPEYIKNIQIRSLKDVAEFVAKSNLVISADTVALHVAGALGKTAWGLLPYEADPRWGNQESTPWYPSVKLYRQKESGNWQEVIDRVSKDLHLWQNQEC